MYTPDGEDKCKCTGRQRSKFEMRLRGPFVDRFQMLAFATYWTPSKGTVSIEELREKIAKAHEFQKSQGRRHGNRRWQPEAKSEKESTALFTQLPTEGSERRRLAIQRVARTYADLELRTEILDEDIFKARGRALAPFENLRRASNRLNSAPDSWA